MVQTNELRIGNWLQYKNNPECAKYFKVQGLWKNTIAEIDYKEQVISGLSELVYEAIPLTPEILEKCGLKKKLYFDIEYYWEKQTGKCSFAIVERKDYYEHLYGYGSHGLRIESLHQLQNLYFSLTGEELICTL